MKFVYPMAGLVIDLVSSVESCTDVYGLKVVGNTTGRGLLAHAASRITVRPDSQTREGHRGEQYNTIIASTSQLFATTLSSWYIKAVFHRNFHPYHLRITVLFANTISRIGFTSGSSPATKFIHLGEPYRASRGHIFSPPLPSISGYYRAYNHFWKNHYLTLFHGIHLSRVPPDSATQPKSMANSSAAAGLLGRQLKQMQTDKDIPGISCGLVDDNVFEWEVMLMINDECKFYGGA